MIVEKAHKVLGIKNIFSFSTLSYIQAIISFAVSFILARIFGPEIYGNYTLGLVFANILLVVMQYGTEKTIVRDLIQIGKPIETLSSAFIIWGSLASLGLLGIGVYLFLFSTFTTVASIVIFLCSLSGSIQGLSFAGWFDFRGKMSLHAFYALIGRLLFLLLILLIIWKVQNQDLSIFLVVIALVASRIVVFGIEFKYVYHSLNFNIKFLKNEIIRILSNNSWVWYAALGNLCMTQFNQMILQKLSGPKQLAYYGVAFQIITLVRLMQSQILRIVTPNIASIATEKSPVKVYKQLIKFSIISFALSIAVIIPLYFITPLLISEFLGDEYNSVIPILNILYVWISIYGVALINNQFLLSLRKEKVFFKITFVFGIFSLFISFYLVKDFESIGAAISLLISHSLSILFQFVVVILTIRKKSLNV